MAFIPEIGMVVWMPRRGETTSTVLGLDLDAGEMWLRPFTGGTKFTATISDRWAEVKDGQTPEMWLVGTANRWFGAGGQVVGFATQVDAENAANGNGNAVRILHIYTDGTTSTLEVI